MSRPVQCDGCEQEIEPWSGWLYAKFKRKFRFRVKKFLARGSKRKRYDFCNHCWNELLSEVRSRANGGEKA